MLWLQRSIATKLFAAFFFTSLLVVLVIAILIGRNMRSGFARYLLDVELQSFDQLVEDLEDLHKKQNEWNAMLASNQRWHEIVRNSLSPVPPGPPGPPDRQYSLQRPKPMEGPLGPPIISQFVDRLLGLTGTNDARRVPPPPPPRDRDRMQFGRRLTLLDLNGGHLAGARNSGEDFVFRFLYQDIDDEHKRNGQTEDDVPFAKLALYSPARIVGLQDNAFLIEQFRLLLLVSLLALVISGVAAFVLSRSLTTRVRSLVEGANQLMAGDYSFRLTEGGKDEISVLQQDFNSLAESLQAAEKAERQWISDASHELKTPLAILKGLLEGLQDGIYQADEGLLVEMLQTVDRLNLLVSDLNLLAHAREGKLLCSLSEENLSEIVMDAVLDIGDRYKAKGLKIETCLPDGLLVQCDRIRIRQLLDNLLENARRYTDGSGLVRVSGYAIECDGGAVCLVIEDSPPRPEREEIGRLFERFYRTDPSRARQSGGSGLGLAICRAIVKAHKGRISAVPSRLGGLAIEVMLPVSPTSMLPQTPDSAFGEKDE